MSVLDQIRKKLLLSTPETVNSEWFSESTSIDDRSGAFSLSLNYENGSSVDMKVWLQLSNDNVNFGDLTDSDATITDSSGVVLYDINGSGAAYIRIRIEVIAGSIDVTEIRYNASQFH